MSIFQKETGYTDYFDRITIGGYDFDAEITVRDKRGDPSAIHCGRIVAFLMTCSDDVIALYDDGTWFNTPTAYPWCSSDEFVETAKVAMDILIRKWSNPEKIRNRTVKTDLF